MPDIMNRRLKPTKLKELNYTAPDDISNLLESNIKLVSKKSSELDKKNDAVCLIK